VKNAVRYRWLKGAWVPWKRFALICDQEFAEGEDRWLEAIEDRSPQSHRHYFACLAEAWQNLPEDLGARFLTPQALRKWALIETGWYTAPEPVMMASNEGALLHAIDLSRRHPYDRVYVDPEDPRRIIWKTAKSQSMRAMRKKDFEQSKRDVLGKVGELIGVPIEELEANAGRAA